MSFVSWLTDTDPFGFVLPQHKDQKMIAPKTVRDAIKATREHGERLGGTTVLDRPPVKRPKSAPLPQSKVDAMQEAQLAEYAELAQTIGIMPPDLGVERFKAYLRCADLPVYSLTDVIGYMDELAKRESKEQAGWEWRPLRQKDNRKDLSFGRMAARQATDRMGGTVISTPASDYYRGQHTEYHSRNVMMSGAIGWSNNQINGLSQSDRYETAASSNPYDRTIPIHALRKIAKIEKEHKGDVAFFVSDYALAPAIQYPDPFLMAVVANPKANKGVGRFIIDFWDEPGFGLEHQLKTDL